MDMQIWYAQLIKPAWAPPAQVFGPVWSVLYFLIILSFGWVFYRIIIGQLPKRLALPFILNLVFNFLFTYLQFVLQNNLLAALDVVFSVYYFVVVLDYYLASSSLGCLRQHTLFIMGIFSHCFAVNYYIFK